MAAFSGWFDLSGDELCANVKRRSGEIVTARWKCADGTVVTPYPTDAVGEAVRYALPEADLTLDLQMTEMVWLNRQFERWLPQKFRPRLATRKVQVTRTSTGRRLGVAACDSQFVYVARKGEGFLLGNDQGFDFYSASPSRDWTWLAGWGLIPPAVVWGLSRVRRGRRRKPLADDAHLERVARVAPVAPQG